MGGDTFMVNGTRQPYVRNSRHEARRASRLLSQAIGVHIPVQDVIVPVGAHRFTLRAEPEDVIVVNRLRLARTLRSLPTVLTPGPGRPRVRARPPVDVGPPGAVPAGQEVVATLSTPCASVSAIRPSMSGSMLSARSQDSW